MFSNNSTSLLTVIGHERIFCATTSMKSIEYLQRYLFTITCSNYHGHEFHYNGSNLVTMRLFHKFYNYLANYNCFLISRPPRKKSQTTIISVNLTTTSA